MSAPLDLLYIGMLSPHRGGSGVASTQILRGLARRGHRVRAVAPIATASVRSGDTFARHCPELDVSAYVVPYTGSSSETLVSPRYRRLEGAEVARLTARRLGERVPEVVIAGRESFAWYMPAILKGIRLPSAAIVHGGTTPQILDGTYPHALASGLLERLRRMDLAITPGRHVASTLRTFGVPRIAVIPNPVDLARFRPGPADPGVARVLGIGDADVVVGHVSNLKPLKRVEDIVESASLALGRDPRLLYLIVGDGPLRPHLERACVERGVAERFRFTGWVPHARVADYLRLTDIVLMPSAAEAQALAYLEAQASARTLVASDIRAATEVVEDGRTGLLFGVGDVEDLTRATLRAACDPGLRLRLGAQARDGTRAHALSRVTAAYEATLLELARPTRAAASRRDRRIR